ncbi:MAG: ABC transporter permease [Ruminococcus sp.]|nr:ABC transporter permease [Ruminococcus sp.]
MFLFNVVVYNISILYGTVGEIITEKSGSMNLGVEGIMAVGAIFGYILGCRADSLLVGILVAFLSSAVCGVLFAVLTVTMHANQNVTGLTLTTFGLGLYFFVGKGLGENWPVMNDAVSLKNALNPIEIPLLKDIPILGKAFFSHDILVYLGIIIAVVMWWYMKHTKPGLRMRAIGENPAAADSLGIKINLYKYIHIMLGAGIMGIGGYYLGLTLGGSFEGSNCWINGYGWISIALVIFANWSTSKAILGTLVFGLFNTLQMYNGSLAYAFPRALGWLTAIPAQLFQALPFIVTAIVLIINSVKKKKSVNAPSAVGVNYFREDR